MQQFTDAERNVFRYHNGETEVYGDPLALCCRLDSLLPQADQLVDRINATGASNADVMALAVAAEATEQMVAGIRASFGMREFDPASGKGATFAQCLGVWETFQAFLSDEK